MAKTKPDHDRDRDPDNDNDPEAAAVAVTPAAGALASLASLGAVLNAVDVTSVTGRSGLPMLQFKRDGGGTWQFGQKGIIAEEGSSWAINPVSFKRGYIAFSDTTPKKVLGERLLSIKEKMPDLTELQDVGGKWQEQWAVNLKCISGTDAGVEVIYKPTTIGGVSAIATLIEAIRDRLNGGQHDGKVSPVVLLEKDSYSHAQFGKVWTPVLTIIDWMSIDGPAPAPKPASPPPATEQPRRRRVG
jgi:hypothetical protein